MTDLRTDHLQPAPQPDGGPQAEAHPSAAGATSELRASGPHPVTDVVAVLHLLREGVMHAIRHAPHSFTPHMISEAFRFLDRSGLVGGALAAEEKTHPEIRALKDALENLGSNLGTDFKADRRRISALEQRADGEQERLTSARNKFARDVEELQNQTKNLNGRAEAQTRAANDIFTRIDKAEDLVRTQVAAFNKVVSDYSQRLAKLEGQVEVLTSDNNKIRKALTDLQALDGRVMGLEDQAPPPKRKTGVGRPVTPEEKAEIRKLRSNGLKVPEIAEVTGRSVTTVGRVVLDMEKDNA